MKDRIRQLMLDKAMSQKSFASELCIAEATLSGIFTGRTRPTNQTVSAIHERFPEVNISWLMFGEGDMYVSSQENKKETSDLGNDESEVEFASDLFSNIVSDSATIDGGMPVNIGSTQALHSASVSRQNGMHNLHAHMPVSAPQVQIVEKFIDKPQRKITEIRIFFDDGTYETFTP